MVHEMMARTPTQLEVEFAALNPRQKKDLLIIMRLDQSLAGYAAQPGNAGVKFWVNNPDRHMRALEWTAEAGFREPLIGEPLTLMEVLHRYTEVMFRLEHGQSRSAARDYFSHFEPQQEGVRPWALREIQQAFVRDVIGAPVYETDFINGQILSDLRINVIKTAGKASAAKADGLFRQVGL